VGERRSPNGDRPLVLVVDDDPGIQATLERYLTSIGYRVAVAGDGAQGLAMAESLAPSVILTDVRMPVMNGHILLRRLNELGRNSSVVLMSGSGDIDDAIDGMRHGAVDYLKKPWTLEELAGVVERARLLSESLDQIAEASGRTDDVASGPPRPTPMGPHRSALDRGVDGVALVERITDLVIGKRAIPRRAAIADPESLDTASLREAFPTNLTALRTFSDRIFDFSEARGLAMRGIAEVSDAEVALDAVRCQHAGLLLDVGAMYLLSEIDAALGQAGDHVADVPKMRAAIEARHTLVGSLILEAWGVDAELVNLVHDHHATALPTSTPAIWCTAALGGALAVHLVGFGDPLGENGLRGDMLARCAYRLGVGDTTLRRLTQSLVLASPQSGPPSWPS
jgi:CheY-like chemotaxis protein